MTTTTQKHSFLMMMVLLLASAGPGCGGRSVGGPIIDAGSRPDRYVPPPTGHIPCVGDSDYDGKVGRRCTEEADCSDLSGGKCVSFTDQDGDPLKFCTRSCDVDADCETGTTCQRTWCTYETMCMPEGCCHGPEYCGREEICVVNRPGGLCPEGPCCDHAGGSFACRLLCDPSSGGDCPAAAPRCESVQVGTEDYVESFDVCLP